MKKTGSCSLCGAVILISLLPCLEGLTSCPANQSSICPLHIIAKHTDKAEQPYDTTQYQMTTTISNGTTPTYKPEGLDWMPIGDNNPHLYRRSSNLSYLFTPHTKLPFS